ncbi:xanthine dehydrogenase accessory protein XdhC [Herbaspirillum sp. RTI4]|uniref:xanthine dehydrogenase accessory protein XdhC n=1 Tax=Herbaspirillum sp. RTI4 TaxID=3048640 RepID=UPI002AB3A6CB|nr:xanthine dehydrogenase accessory protein XdhC [Herbaspirillum sp. RTI4]MDY7578235.1 xanthine dehydrogenase accessory protein XdhC [Herbaspirillum sp. RTI4]MEA9981573.1 xanthine dehydrogenase accessory protein XdhC [Herbaspirillum sp. RTI4]
MNNWLSALRQWHAAGTTAVLVTVANTQGSTPRKAGARMVFSAGDQCDTIGGGHLEWRAAQIARRMLEDALEAESDAPAARRRLERIALGPSLGQCCGGAVTLAFERMDARDAADSRMLDTLHRHEQQGVDLWRKVSIDDPSAPPTLEADSLAMPGAYTASDTHIAQDAQGNRWLYDHCRAQRPQVVLFGAGHVGTALVRVLSTLPCSVLWVDERTDLFPADLPPHVMIEATDTPNAVVDLAEPGAYFVVMTHSHALDQQLTERILRRSDMGWFGLIGSLSKRRQFEHRLRERGFDDVAVNRMTCPIGIAGINGKEPASIALSVAAQLLQLWERQALHQHSPDIHRLLTQ